MDNAAEVGQYTLDALAEIQTRHPSIGDVRGIGLMIGVEFVKNKNTKEPADQLRDMVVDRSFESRLAHPRLRQEHHPHLAASLHQQTPRSMKVWKSLKKPSLFAERESLIFKMLPDFARPPARLPA